MGLLSDKVGVPPGWVVAGWRFEKQGVASMSLRRWLRASFIDQMLGKSTNTSPTYSRVMREQMREQLCLRPCNRHKHLTSGGGGEIRTLGGLSPSLVFKTSAFNRSATPPR